MRDVVIASMIYLVLFVILTSQHSDSFLGFTGEMSGQVRYLVCEVIFWIGTFYICASATYGAFARHDRFALSHKHPFLNRIFGVALITSPFMAMFFDVRFVFLLLGLLLFSHLRSKTDEERRVDFTKSRALSNIILLPLFTVALMLMNVNGYYVTSLLNFGSTTNSEIAGKNASG